MNYTAMTPVLMVLVRLSLLYIILQCVSSTNDSSTFESYHDIYCNVSQALMILLRFSSMNYTAMCLQY